jgi:hypothetical protein
MTTIAMQPVMNVMQQELLSTLIPMIAMLIAIVVVKKEIFLDTSMTIIATPIVIFVD